MPSNGFGYALKVFWVFRFFGGKNVMMDVDLTVALIKATVQIDQPISEAKRMVGTGFLVSVPRADGTTQIVLVTAAHVFEKMPAADVRIGWRVQGVKGNWSYVP